MANPSSTNTTTFELLGLILTVLAVGIFIPIWVLLVIRDMFRGWRNPDLWDDKLAIK